MKNREKNKSMRTYNTLKKMETWKLLPYLLVPLGVTMETAINLGNKNGNFYT